MNQLVSEILISCIVVTLIVCMIPLYHQSMELMGNTASMLLAEERVPAFLPETQANGADVISLVDYYSDNMQVSVTVSTDYGSKTYLDTTYQEDPYPYPFSLEQAFQMDVIYESKRISSIHFTLEED